MNGGPGSGLSRRRLLTALLLAPAVAAAGSACSFASPEPEGPDPLIALADAARADAALAAAAVAAVPSLAERVLPLRDARTEHATALDAEIARLDPAYTPAMTPTGPGVGATPPPADLTAALTGLREALAASGQAAGAATLVLPVDRVGLVGSIAACCTVYSGVMT